MKIGVLSAALRCSPLLHRWSIVSVLVHVKWPGKALRRDIGKKRCSEACDFNLAPFLHIKNTLDHLPSWSLLCQECSATSMPFALHTCFTYLQPRNRCPPSSFSPLHITHLVSSSIPSRSKFILTAKVLRAIRQPKCLILITRAVHLPQSLPVLFLHRVAVPPSSFHWMMRHVLYFAPSSL